MSDSIVLDREQVGLFMHYLEREIAAKELMLAEQKTMVKMVEAELSTLRREYEKLMRSSGRPARTRGGFGHPGPGGSTSPSPDSAGHERPPRPEFKLKLPPQRRLVPVESIS